jgi:predicted metal-dependent peptidase
MAVELVDLITQFRMTVYKHFPYLSPYVYALTPVERPGLGTMAVDKYGRMYYDPAWCETLTLDEGGYVCVHEAWHLILRHCHRARTIIGDNPTPKEARDLNIAMDIVVWEMMEAIADLAPKGGVTFPEAKKQWPEIERNMTIEQLYSIIGKPVPPDPTGGAKTDPFGDPADGNQDGEGEGQGSEDGDQTNEPGNQGNEPSDQEGDNESNGGGDDKPSDEKTDGKGGGKGDNNPKSDGQGKGDQDGPPSDNFDLIGGGSSADGLPRDYEEEYDPAWDAYKEDRMLEAVENKIAELEEDREWINSRGTIPGCLKSLIKHRLHPQPNPWDALRATVQLAVKAPRGNPDYTYQRPNRRQNAVPDMPLLKGLEKHSPKAVLIIDTSGSMTSQCLAKAITVIKQGLMALGGRVPVICCDTRVTTDAVLTKVHDTFEFGGRGGTDMRVPIEYAQKKYRPDVTVLVTDTGTPWPDKPIKGQLIVAATQDGHVPNWATKVRIPDHPDKDRLDD